MCSAEIVTLETPTIPNGKPIAEGDPIVAYLVGGGIASMAAAAFLIRDARMPGHRITIFEELEELGGSLDGSGEPQSGYLVRGTRMLERHYVCTFDLFSSIPTLDERTTVTREIADWNETLQTVSEARLFRAGQRVERPALGLTERHILALERLVIEPEGWLGAACIADQFDATFFRTDFWIMWCTTFAFQPWHSAVEFKRYLLRFMHLIAGFNALHGIIRTVYNQHDSLVLPLKKWLASRGVRFVYNTRVTDLGFDERVDRIHVNRIIYERAGERGEALVAPGDLVFVTLGSITEASSLGSTHTSPALNGKRDGGAWTLWETIAAKRPGLGRPTVFDDHIDESKWVSFTATLHDPEFFATVRERTGNVPGEGGLVTFADSNWLASIVLPHQPYFIGQPPDVQVFWGYGLHVDKLGNFVRKTLSACTGAEILTEVLGHLGIDAKSGAVLQKATVIPCMMPFITSGFLRRAPGDRPPVVPDGSDNLAFVGQFCELPGDVVFTVEYSVRSAQTAVYALLGIKREPPAVYRGYHDPRTLVEAFSALHGTLVY
jgi:oleate hydratase